MLAEIAGKGPISHEFHDRILYRIGVDIVDIVSCHTFYLAVHVVKLY